MSIRVPFCGALLTLFAAQVLCVTQPLVLMPEPTDEVITPATTFRFKEKAQKVEDSSTAGQLLRPVIQEEKPAQKDYQAEMKGGEEEKEPASEDEDVPREKGRAVEQEEEEEEEPVRRKQRQRPLGRSRKPAQQERVRHRKPTGGQKEKEEEEQDGEEEEDSDSEDSEQDQQNAVKAQVHNLLTGKISSKDFREKLNSILHKVELVNDNAQTLMGTQRGATEVESIWIKIKDYVQKLVSQHERAKAESPSWEQIKSYVGTLHSELKAKQREVHSEVQEQKVKDQKREADLQDKLSQLEDRNAALSREQQRLSAALSSLQQSAAQESASLKQRLFGLERTVRRLNRAARKAKKKAKKDGDSTDAAAPTDDDDEEEDYDYDDPYLGGAYTAPLAPLTPLQPWTGQFGGYAQPAPYQPAQPPPAPVYQAPQDRRRFGRDSQLPATHSYRSMSSDVAGLNTALLGLANTLKASEKVRSASPGSQDPQEAEKHEKDTQTAVLAEKSASASQSNIPPADDIPPPSLPNYQPPAPLGPGVNQLVDRLDTILTAPQPLPD